MPSSARRRNRLQRFLRRDGVQAGERLIQEQDARLHHQYTRQGYLLLLATEMSKFPVAQVQIPR